MIIHAVINGKLYIEKVNINKLAGINQDKTRPRIFFIRGFFKSGRYQILLCHNCYSMNWYYSTTFLKNSFYKNISDN